MATKTGTAKGDADSDVFASKMREIDERLAANATNTVTTASPPGVSSASDSEWWSTHNAMTMSSAVLIFGVAILALSVALIRKGTASDDVLKVFGTIVIIVMAIFLVIAGYNDQQIAPAMGLLGTIAGYLLGRESRKALETSPK